MWDNYVLWKAQFLPAVRGAQLVGMLEGSVSAPWKVLEVKVEGKKQEISNPEYISWVSTDQQLLSYLLNSITTEVLAGVATTTTSAEAWKVLEYVCGAINSVGDKFAHATGNPQEGKPVYLSILQQYAKH